MLKRFEDVTKSEDVADRRRHLHVGHGGQPHQPGGHPPSPHRVVRLLPPPLLPPRHCPCASLRHRLLMLRPSLSLFRLARARALVRARVCMCVCMCVCVCVCEWQSVGGGSARLACEGLSPVADLQGRMPLAGQWRGLWRLTRKGSHSCTSPVAPGSPWLVDQASDLN